jgi:hypothetical protein
MAHPPLHAASQLTDRIETRWLLNTQAYGRVLKLLAQSFVPLHYSDRPWVRSVYFNNDAHDVPLEINLKLRQYFSAPHRGSFRIAKGKWFFETKAADLHNASRERKTRELLPLKDALARGAQRNLLCDLSTHEVLCPLNAILRPYTAIEYHRVHFVLPDARIPFRITVDRDTRFWHQHREGGWLPLGTEFGIRLEVKCGVQALAAPQWRALIGLLKHERAVPVIPKRLAAMNRLNYWQRSLVPLPFNELPGFEYEIIFDVPEQNAHAMSAEIYGLFHQKGGRFRIDPHRRWMSEWSMVRIYLQNHLRLNLYGDTFRWIWKTPHTGSSPFPYLHQKREEKGEDRLITPHQIKDFLSRYAYRGAILQNRRQCWIRDAAERVYKISLHRSSNIATHHGRTQIALEYVGRALLGDPHDALPRVKRQLQTLAALLRKRFPFLTTEKDSLYTFACMREKNNISPELQVLQGFMPHPQRGKVPPRSARAHSFIS